MGFLSQDKGSKSNNTYLETAEEPKTCRPVVASPTPVWVHTIPEVKTTGPSGQPVVVRRFATEACTSNSRSGVGCQCCTTQDPLWNLLDAKSKVNKKGQRVDFPKKCIHVMPVFDHTTASVRVLKGGNQLYEVMDQWYESQPEGQKDLRRCDWKVWKTGKGLLTRYNVVREDASTFNFTQAMVTDGQAVLQKAIQDLAPAAPDEFQKMINGEDPNQPEASRLGQFAVQHATGFLSSSVPAPTQSTVVSTVTSPYQAPVTVPSVVLPTAVTQPAVFTVPVPVPTTPTPVQPVAPVATGTSALTEFISWINTQPELCGTGILKHLMPTLKEQLNGSTDFHACSPEQLTALRLALSNKLNSIRNRG